MIGRLIVVSLCISASTTVYIPCDWYPTVQFRDVAIECSGEKVKQLPKMLPRSLNLLRLTGTGIRTLDVVAFHGLELPDVTSMHVSRGELTTVGTEALCWLPALTQLDLSYNKLKLLHASSFRCNKHLRSVNLSGNPSLRHLPTLESSSVETMYVENCGLESIDVATVRGMTALKALYVSGNRNLHCPSVKRHFSYARPGLLVDCDESIAALSPPVEQEGAQQNWLSETDSATTANTTTTYTTKTASASSSPSGLPLSVTTVVTLTVFHSLIIQYYL